MRYVVEERQKPNSPWRIIESEGAVFEAPAKVAEIVATKLTAYFGMKYSTASDPRNGVNRKPYKLRGLSGPLWPRHYLH